MLLVPYTGTTPIGGVWCLQKAPVIVDVTWPGQAITEYHLQTAHEEEEEEPSLILQITYSDVCHLLAAG